jgi:hypothetical protein
LYTNYVKDVIKKQLTPRTFNGGMSCLLAWWQILHSLALLGHKHNNLTWQ